MSDNLHPAAQCFIAELWEKPVGFIAVISYPHPRVKNLLKIHRLVVLPDYQGIGIGKSLLNFVAELYFKKKKRVMITTSHPAVNHFLNKDKRWILIRQSRVKGNAMMRESLFKRLSRERITCTWEFKGL